MAVWNCVKLRDITNRARIEAEFYRPEFLACQKIVESIPHVRLGSARRKITDGTHFTPRYTSSGTRFYSAVNVKEGYFVHEKSFKFITEAEHRAIHKRCPVRAGDVLLRKVGVGPRWSCVVPDGLEEFSIFVSVAMIRPADTIQPEYLSTFMNCHYGQLQLLRLNKGISQPDLHLEDIGELIVPVLASDDQFAVRHMVRESQSLRDTSRTLFMAAQAILEAELGLDKLIFQKPVGYIANFSEALISQRIDADYFQTPFRQIDHHLDKYSTAQLHTLVDITKGVEVGSGAYQAEGHPFLRVSNVKETGIELGPSDKYISPTLYAALQSYRPQIGELLLTKDGSPGVAMAVDQDCNGIISGGVVRLKPKTDGIPNEYLALAINSLSCRMQIERECSGALILHWKPTLIRKLRVPILPVTVMDKIAELATEAKQTKRKADELIEQAKTRVEQLIEEAVQP
jgi:hypothetical protein